MKIYTGTKTINATPMLRGEYNVLRGWVLPADEDGADEGYLVEYTDGGKANHPDFAGYISWSPKDVFERAYHPVRAPHEQRVIDEKTELDKKLYALRRFNMSSPVFPTLDAVEQRLLVRQEIAMQVYSSILEERIGAFA